MTIISISLPASQIDTVDKLVGKYGFASRSELMRCLIRYCQEHYPDIHTYPFTRSFHSPSIEHPEEFVKALEKTGKYPKVFLRNIMRGLRQYNGSVKNRNPGIANL